MKIPYDVSKLIKKVHSELNDKLTLAEVEELLTVSEDAYHKDSPLSVGKRLIIQYIEFTGTKQLDGVTQPIDYRRHLCSGVNMWVGDNLVGKSSIFKIIKLALTGDDAVAKDVMAWLDEIWVEFGLGSNSYLAHILRNKNNKLQFELLKGRRTDIILLAEASKSSESTEYDFDNDTTLDQGDNTLFQGGVGKYQEFIKNFFFHEFSYYSLQWTQKDSRPGSIDLNTSNASWLTYYKSVFLEAEDYGILFYGNQAELIFQMLLGLELTYPINRLSIKKKHLTSEIAKLENAKALVKASQKTNDADKRKESEQKLVEITERLLKLEELAKKASAPQPHTNAEQQLEILRKNHLNAVDRRSTLEQEKTNLEDSQITLKRKIISTARQIQDYETEIKKRIREIDDLRELLELGAFFNSLEVHTCPNCNHTVEKQRVTHEKKTGSCRLCDHEVEQQEFDDKMYNNQIKSLDHRRQLLFNEQYGVKIKLADLEADLRKSEKRIEAIDIEIQSLNIDYLANQINSAKQLLTQAKPAAYDWTAHVAEVAELSSKQALLKQGLAEPISPPSIQGLEAEYLESLIQAIDKADIELQQERNKRSQSLIQTFESLYLKQLHAFGLTNYKRVEIKSNFKVTYFINDGEYNFNDISVGEKLRAKLGLYIALIELDVEHQLGRHPRLLILDSPAGEEGDSAYVQGLSSTLAYIQEQFGNSLQVLVGTAQRGLSNSVDSNQVEVKAVKEYFF